MSAIPYTGYWIDVDPRVRTSVCKHCAREVQIGSKCVCVPSQSFRVVSKDGSEPRPFVVSV